jgi:hypothetical protein
MLKVSVEQTAIIFLLVSTTLPSYFVPMSAHFIRQFSVVLTFPYAYVGTSFSVVVFRHSANQNSEFIALLCFTIPNNS